MDVTASGTLQCEASPVEVREVTISALNSSLPVGTRYGLEAVAVYADGSTMRITSAGQVTWSSGDETIARVDAMGIMMGLRPGMVTISARYQGVSGQQSYTFVAP